MIRIFIFFCWFLIELFYVECSAFKFFFLKFSRIVADLKDCHKLSYRKHFDITVHKQTCRNFFRKYCFNCIDSTNIVFFSLKISSEFLYVMQLEMTSANIRYLNRANVFKFIYILPPLKVKLKFESNASKNVEMLMFVLQWKSFDLANWVNFKEKIGLFDIWKWHHKVAFSEHITENSIIICCFLSVEIILCHGNEIAPIR